MPFPPDRPPVRSSTVLLVEDEPVHAETIIQCFKAYPNVRIHHVDTGEVALDYCFQRNAYADPATSARPDLIILDLCLPTIHGTEVLRQIRKEPALMTIPVVILTSSSAPNDITTAYQLNANSYLVKPVDYAEFCRVMDSLGVYWFGLNVPPP